MSKPLALIAEITHRCPLHCVYCSNPLEMIARGEELPVSDWLEIFRQAAAIGMFHVHLTGGEPLARSDLTQLVRGAHQAGLYTNLITSGIGLSRERLSELVEAGLDHTQISFQDSEESQANWIAGARAHQHKLEVANWLREYRIAFTANLVVHRQNIEHLEQMIVSLEALGPDRMEIAHAQYYGWALKNRSALLPTREQLDRAVAVAQAAQERLRGKIRIDVVVPDYHARFPKACMGGWGRQLMLIDPAGRALPCHAAGVIPGLKFDRAPEHSLDWIWRNSEAFQRFRGDGWMPEPCRSCDRRNEDFGGCRCQAFLLAGNAAATDPVCQLAPTHHLVEAALAESGTAGVIVPELRKTPFHVLREEMSKFWSYRTDPE
jgi:pyrroloquinoline quinone biosynthesis protein E